MLRRTFEQEHEVQASITTKTVIRGLATLLLPLLLGSPALALKTNYCEAEMAARAAEKLTPEQADQLDRYQGFNISTQERWEVAGELVRAHLAGEQQRIGAWKPDGSAVATCLIKTVADGNKDKNFAPYALEAYGLMLLSGQGVKQDRAQGMAYLERAANWNYGSASMHLANIYLADKGNPESRSKAMRWLDRAIFSEIPHHSADPRAAPGMLFDLYLPKSGRQDLEEAEALYRRMARVKRFHEDLLKTVLPRIPGLARSLEEERVALEYQRRSDERMQCQRYQSSNPKMGVECN
jgi:hypothetical protein